jgi:hypothetical protein
MERRLHFLPLEVHSRLTLMMVYVSPQLHWTNLTVPLQDEEWTEEEKLHQGFKKDEFAFLSDMLGPKGMAFDNDEVLDNHDEDDEDLKNDPVMQMDIQVR